MDKFAGVVSGAAVALIGQVRWSGLGMVLGSCLMLGCNSGDQVYHLSGDVTYKGKPVPSGMIIFEPDNAQGNSGGPGRAKIHDGKYDTREEDGAGIVGGPHLIRITGLDGGTHGQTAGEIGLPNMLFPEYQTKEDLPKEDAVKNFEVPAQR